MHDSLLLYKIVYRNLDQFKQFNSALKWLFCVYTQQCMLNSQRQNYAQSSLEKLQICIGLMKSATDCSDVCDVRAVHRVQSSIPQACALNFGNVAGLLLLEPLICLQKATPQLESAMERW